MDSSDPIVHKKSSNLKLSECGKYEENPFLEKAIRAVEGGVVKKYKSASSYDQRAVLQAVVEGRHWRLSNTISHNRAQKTKKRLISHT